MLMVFSVFDARSGSYSPHLYCAVNEQVAARMFQDAVMSREETMLRSHSEDFSLRCVGLFDEDSGLLVEQDPKVVISAEEIVRRSVPREEG